MIYHRPHAKLAGTKNNLTAIVKLLMWKWARKKRISVVYAF